MAKKFLDQDGLTYLISKLDDYPTNEILAAVIEGVDQVKADVESPVFTGTPEAPTADSGSNTTQIATTAFVQTELSKKSILITDSEISRDTTQKADLEAPYNLSYGSTNLTIDLTKVPITALDLQQGFTIGIMLATAVASSYRNVRIRLGSTGDWIPLYYTTSILDGSSYLGTSAYRQLIYSKKVNSAGAFHIINDTNSTYSPAQLGGGYGTCTTASATAAKTATLLKYALTTGGIVSVKFNEAVCANATLNINSRGAKAIYYHNTAITADVIKATDIATFVYDGTYYQLLHTNNNETDASNLATVATTGSYNDLSDKPTAADLNAVPTSRKVNGYMLSSDVEIVDCLTEDEYNALPATKTSDNIFYVLTDVDGDSSSSTDHTHTTADITNFPTLATVATSGNYNDLSNKPTIPTVNNATLTIQKNGTTVGTFTANASSNATANITVPTQASDIDAVPTTRTVNGKALSSNIEIDYLPFTTTAPTAANTTGLKVAVLASEPATKYNGWIYLIQES